MDRKAKAVCKWINNHKTEVAVIGGIAGTAVAVVIGTQYSKPLVALREPLNDTLQEALECDRMDMVNMMNPILSEKAPHEVSSHIRNLPEGWSPSVHKIESAPLHGYDLGPGQTWVEGYQVG